MRKRAHACYEPRYDYGAFTLDTCLTIVLVLRHGNKHCRCWYRPCDYGNAVCVPAIYDCWLCACLLGVDVQVIIDTIQADTVAEGDFVVIGSDHIEVTNVYDNDMITISGYSHDTGDNVEYEMPFDTYLDLWMGYDD